MKNIFSFFTFICLAQLATAQENNSGIKGYVFTIEESPIANAQISIDGKSINEATSNEGCFDIEGLSEGDHTLTISLSKYKTHSETITLNANEVKEITITLREKGHIENVTIIGNAKTPLGLESITRLPLNPRDLSQNISIIPEKILKEQGAETITDAVRNVPGVTLFGSYGGVKESMSIRGYRGVPVLKNGVQIDSDFRTASLLTDLNGIENIQVLKGSAAVTQGIGNGLGSPGGVINVVTKTPQFTNKGEISLKSGSWGLFRPAFDYQTVLDKKQTAAFRLNGVFQRTDSYKSFVNNNRIYINPSFEWRPNYRTTITLEMDYMNDNTTPNRGTVNLGDDWENHLYKMPNNKFLGWKTDNVNTKTTTYSARFIRELDNNLSLRVLYAGSINEVENIGVESMIKPIKGEAISMRARNLGRSDSEDKNRVIQIDLIGKELYTGKIKHTFQAGFDYKTTDRTNISYASNKIDIIDILGPISNELPSNKSNSTLIENGRTSTNSEVYGIMVQEAVEFNKYIRANLALRYSQNARRDNANAANYSWDPFFGLMVTPIKNISFFGNYATTTDLRSANNPTPEGGTVGSSVSNQWEFGMKSDWFNQKLAVNLTYFHIRNNDLAYQVYNNGKATGLYELAGDITRKGIDVEVTGKILNNLNIILGYSYLDAKYKNSPAYHYNSRPSNTPQNTANGWVRYLFNEGTLKDLSIGAGVYYVGNRPVNDYSVAGADPHGNNYPKAPFNMPEYTTVNMQLGYKYKSINFSVFFNNIFDEVGYTSYYRGGYIDQIDPRNFKAQISYNF